MNPRRLYGPAVLGTLAAGGVAFFAASRTWVSTRIVTEGLPSDAIAVTGSSAQPVVPALALVAVTAALAVLASSPRIRRVVGVFTVLVGLAGLVLVLTGTGTVDGALRRAVEESPAFTGGRIPTTQGTLWPVITALAFVAVAAVGALTARHGPRWPTMSTRYDAPGSAPVRTDADMWKSLDEGHDPTQ